MDDPMVNYAVNDVPGEKWTWRSSNEWPVPGVETQTWHLAALSADSVDSVNGGSLLVRPEAASTVQSYQVNVDTTTGRDSRWANCVDANLSYPDVTSNDRLSLTYTTPPLEHDVTVVGYPIARFSVSTSAKDGDVWVLLEEVDVAGRSTLVTEGQLRLSMRRTDKAPWHDMLWRREFWEDVLPVEPDEIYDVEISLLPTAYLFNRGNRIRLTVNGADHDNAVLPEFPESELGIQLGGENGSKILLPVLPDGGSASSER